MISYSQNFEDVYIARAFADVAEGFYIDLGAYDPFEDSITTHFYLNGWSGINVEPGPHFERFIGHRPRDINVNAAITGQDGTATFYFHEGDPGTSTLHKHIDLDLALRVGNRAAIEVPAMRLETLLRDYADDRHIHFLKIDVEGLEGAIIRDVDWRQRRPELLIIESTFPYTNMRCDQTWAPTLLAGGYIEVYFDGINVYHLREESMARAHAFRMPVNMLDQAVKFNSGLSPNGLASDDPGLGDMPEPIRRYCDRLQALARNLLSASDICSRRSYAEQKLLLAVNAETAAWRRGTETRVEELAARIDTTLQILSQAQADLARSGRKLAAREDELNKCKQELRRSEDALLQLRWDYEKLTAKAQAQAEAQAQKTQSLAAQLASVRAKLSVSCAKALQFGRRHSEVAARLARAERELAEQDCAPKSACDERDRFKSELGPTRAPVSAPEAETERIQEDVAQEPYDEPSATVVDAERQTCGRPPLAEPTTQEQCRTRARLVSLERDNARLGEEIAQRTHDFALTLSVETTRARRAAIQDGLQISSLKSELDAANSLIGLCRQAFLGRSSFTARSPDQRLLSRIRTSVRRARKSVRRSEVERVILESGLFDEPFYIQTNPDVSSSGFDALQHYLSHGSMEGRRPHPLFDDEFYRATYPDVQQSNMNPLFHFVRYGFKEGRRPNALF